MAIQIKCPVCSKRLFDIEKKSTGRLSIKCTKCKKIININLEESKAKVK